ncbi:Uncharacterised protein [Granulicatella adiacens]|uniref:DUF6037 family protein n=1 Tax=Granulicatella adiacens TaxID=46124 RepID=UPI00195C9D26|nr:DUF6037 family protein [Granulicatella adiacens]VTX65823.1 Uncharacterised protein [Granulicatella adiacens]
MLSNLKLLNDDMKNKGWIITSFTFRYKTVNYIVLVKRFLSEEKRENKYSLVKLEFMKENDLVDSLLVEANSKQIFVDAKIFRKYFGIAYVPNLGDIFKQFYGIFGKSIPSTIKIVNTDFEKTAMVKSLSISDSEDPTKIYCTNVRRNPEGQKRSVFNSDKTKILRPRLYEYFKDEESISFCYSNDECKNNDDATILKNFSK